MPLVSNVLPPRVQQGLGNNSLDAVSRYLSSRGYSNDDAYLKLIEQYKDKSYYNRLLENPWLFSKQAPFSPSTTQELSRSIFGDYSAWDNYYGLIQGNQSEWLSKMVDQMEQQDYNSPINQVAREGAAGLNSDLLGNIEPGSAAENDQPSQGGIAMNPNGSSGMLDASKGVLDFIGKIFQFGQSIQSLSLGSASLVASELGNDSSAFSNVVSQIASLVPLNVLDGKPIEDGDINIDIPALVKEAEYELSRFSRPTRKFMKNWFEQLKDGNSMAVDAVKSELRNRILANNESSAQIKGAVTYDDDFNKMVQNVFKSISSLEYDVWKTELDARKRGAEAKEVDSEVQKAKEDAWNKVYKAVAGDKWYNTAAMILLPLLRNYLEGFTSRGVSGGSSESVGTSRSDAYGNYFQSSSRSNSSSKSRTWHF